ncbi:MAG: phosphopantetheine-binding protein [Dehalococcoidia bacterium]
MTVDHDSLEDYVLRVLSEKLHQPGLQPTTRLIDDGILDSLAFVDLVLQVEQDLGLRIGIEETDLDVFSTPAAIAAHLRTLTDSST